MGDGRKAVRKRAVGTREHIMAYLTEAGELDEADTTEELAERELLELPATVDELDPTGIVPLVVPA